MALTSFRQSQIIHFAASKCINIFGFRLSVFGLDIELVVDCGRLSVFAAVSGLGLVGNLNRQHSVCCLGRENRVVKWES